MTESTSTTTAPQTLAETLSNAEFVQLAVRPDGDALAAAGLIADALSTVGTPFQATTAREPPTTADTDTLVVPIGPEVGETAISARDGPASVAAFAVAEAIEASEPDPVLALAGVVAAGKSVDSGVADAPLSAAHDRGLVSQRPGVALPTSDLSTGLAASTLLRTAYSGSPEEVEAMLADAGLSAEMTDEDHRRLASLVAIDVASAPHAEPTAAKSLGRALSPYTFDGPFQTVGGYADVLDALAKEAPGTGLALALATDPDPVVTTALETWRTHGTTAHRALSNADRSRYDGTLVARVSADTSVLSTIARLLCEFASPEPVVIAVGDAAVSVTATADEGVDSVDDAVAAVASEFGGTAWGTNTRGTVSFDAPIDTAAVTAATREAIAR